MEGEKHVAMPEEERQRTTAMKLSTQREGGDSGEEDGRYAVA